MISCSKSKCAGDKEMNIQQMNLALVHVLQEWDPFNMGGENYEPEIAEAIFAVSEAENHVELANRLKAIYEFSFEEKLDMSQYLQVAAKLIVIRNNASCSL